MLGKIKTSAKWLISPRVLMSAEDCRKYGALSLAPVRQLYREIAELFRGLRNQPTPPKINIANKVERARHFYDEVYNNQLFGDALGNLHRGYYLGYKYSVGLCLILFVVSIVLISAPRFTALPNWVLAIAVLIGCVALGVRGLTMAYFAWLIQQRLTTELFSFRDYLSISDFIKRLPSPSISKMQKEEIRAEEKIRVQLILKKLKENPSINLDEYGLSLPPEVVLNEAPVNMKTVAVNNESTALVTAGDNTDGGAD